MIIFQPLWLVSLQIEKGKKVIEFLNYSDNHCLAIFISDFVSNRANGDCEVQETRGVT